MDFYNICFLHITIKPPHSMTVREIKITGTEQTDNTINNMLDLSAFSFFQTFFVKSKHCFKKNILFVYLLEDISALMNTVIHNLNEVWVFIKKSNKLLNHSEHFFLNRQTTHI